MSDPAAGAAATEMTAAEERERKTGAAELFFDLVFVYAITQVTALILADTSPGGFARSFVVLALIYWAWSAYAWTTNAVDPGDGANRLVFACAMAAALVAAQALPDAYSDDGLWFALPYLVLRLTGIAMTLVSMRHDADYLRVALRITPFFLIAPALVVAGSLLDPTPRAIVWAVAVAIDVYGAIDAGRGGRAWRVSAAHFAERYQLLVIIALGESVVAIGVGAGTAHGAGTVLAMLIAILGTMTLWFAYFDWIAVGAERRLAREPDATRGQLARDLYTFCHFGPVAGIILFAVAAKKTVGHPGDPLSAAGRFALAAAFALYMLGLAIARWRAVRRLAWERVALVAGVAIVALALRDAPAAAVLGAAVGISALLLGIETRRTRELRAALRG